nr:sodium/hydrogen exchanger 9B2-like isoform X5 [Equus asinus]
MWIPGPARLTASEFSEDKLVWKRACLVLGLSVLSVFSSVYLGFPGSGGLCTLLMAFLAGMGWSSEKAEVEKIIAVAWDIFQPLLFGLIGAEVSIASLRPETVAICHMILSRDAGQPPVSCSSSHHRIMRANDPYTSTLSVSQFQ